MQDQKDELQPEKKEAPKDNNAPNPAVQVTQMGNSMVVSFSKKALQGMQNGGSFPVRIVSGDQAMHLVFMRDQTFKHRMRQYLKAEANAKGKLNDMAQDAIDEKQEQKDVVGP